MKVAEEGAWKAGYHLKHRIVLDLPRVGRYRLYDLGPRGSNRIRCRLCGRWFVRDNAWRHFQTETDRCQGSDGFGTPRDPWVEMDARIAFLLRVRRSRKNRRHGQYQYATGGEPWLKR